MGTSTLTPNKGLQKPDINTTDWGTILNASLSSLDNVLGANTPITVSSSGTTALSLSQVQNSILLFSGTLTTNVIYTLPAPNTGGSTTIVGGTWVVANSTTGAYTLTIAGTSTTVAITQGQSRVIYSDGTNVYFADSLVSAFPAGTVMMFLQASAPTGWTQSTTYNDYALRIVSGVGTGNAGGQFVSSAQGFNTVFASQTVPLPQHTHAVTDPGHLHTFNAVINYAPSGTTYAPPTGGGINLNPPNQNTTSATTGITIANAGTSGAAINLAINYINAIVATKN